MGIQTDIKAFKSFVDRQMIAMILSWAPLNHVIEIEANYIYL
ncbi:hypothetical protein BGP_1446 [Beggiatoa sp. PS]|nr:hypothetical protein BGP_1446 [Beggiatoa sp. PS]